ncbi:MAG: ABC transporter substrate-binding protein [Limnochordia bacterium]|jgi:peptide/nickel transport system substrate-binding protein|nr:ABC transporter substrate-binding protein [Bacillota bacterium]
MNKRFKGLAYVLCLAMLLNVGAIPSLAAANYQDTITIGVANDVTTLDPQGSNTDANMMAFLLTHQTIVDIDPDTGEIIPGLASSWTVSEDGCTFTFEVPEGVKFSDGTPFVIEDIKYTYERADKSSFTKSKVSLITNMEIIDDRHIAITIEKPSQEFLVLLAHKSMSILSEKLTEGQEFGYQIGTGLFAVERWVPGDYVSFVRNEHFHGEKSPTRRIVFRLIKEESSRLIALQTGEIDVCVDPLATDLPYIENDKNLELVSIPNVVMLYIALNNEKPGLDNVHVRRAIAHATDKESMILVGYNGVGTVHNNFINRGQFGLYEDIPVYEYDLDKAKEELAKSGYKPGDLSFTVIYNDTAKENMALILQSDLAKIGINLQLVKMETAALKAVLNDAALDYEFCLYQWTDADGTDFTVRNMYGSYEVDGKLVKNGSNRGNIKDAKLNEMIDAALVEMDPEVREKMYHEIELYLFERCPIVPIATSMINIGIKKGITGVKWIGTAKHDYRYIALPLN